MRILLFLLFILSFFSNTALEYIGSSTLRLQTEVDEFGHYSSIIEPLFIGGSDFNITDPSPHSTLISIDGILNIGSEEILPSLNGLSNLSLTNFMGICPLINANGMGGIIVNSNNGTEYTLPEPKANRLIILPVITFRQYV